MNLNLLITKEILSSILGMFGCKTGRNAQLMVFCSKPNTIKYQCLRFCIGNHVEKLKNANEIVKTQITVIDKILQNVKH